MYAVTNAIRDENCHYKCNQRLLYYYIYNTNELMVIYKIHAHFNISIGQKNNAKQTINGVFFNEYKRL